MLYPIKYASESFSTAQYTNLQTPHKILKLENGMHNSKINVHDYFCATLYIVYKLFTNNVVY